ARAGLRDVSRASRANRGQHASGDGPGACVSRRCRGTRHPPAGLSRRRSDPGCWASAGPRTAAPRASSGLRWRTEVPLPIEGDLRAWDAMITGPRWRVAVEAETVIEDVQALERKLSRKQRDGGIDHVMILIADTHRNRRAVAAAPAAFR